MLDKFYGLWYHSTYGPTDLVGQFTSFEDAQKAKFVFDMRNQIRDESVEYTEIVRHDITTFEQWDVDHVPTD